MAPQVYRKYIMVDNKGTRILYVKLQKALYGLMLASLLFYRKLRKEIKEYGFKVNPYNPCVANMMTKYGKQLTVIWHVYNLMASGEDNFELTKLSCYLCKIYGPKLSMHTGKKHNYLGVKMEFNEDRTLSVSMITYLKNVIAGFPEEIRGKANSPATDHLFLVKDKTERRRWRRKKLSRFTIPWHSYCSCVPEKDKTYRLQWLF
jgi:hypothetical protein